MMVAVILFPFGVRLSTWATGLAFLAIYAARRDQRVLLAAWAWMWGFEAAFDATALMVGHTGRHAAQAFYLVLGCFTVVWMTFHERLRPALPIMLAVAALWVVWVAVGFPVNLHNTTTINPLAEVLNETTKTLWAVAYLVPLLRVRSHPFPKADAERLTRDAATADFRA